MRKPSRENLNLFLLPIGLFVLFAIITLTHFTRVPDFVSWLLEGIGISLIFLTYVLAEIKTRILGKKKRIQ